jgi:hypothetical protein
VDQYQIGDRVVKSGLDINYHGVVHQVILPEQIPEALAIMHRANPHDTERIIDEFSKRDPDWQNHALYFVEPDSSGGVATFEEAKRICPALNEIQYQMIVNRRAFLVLDSQLLPEQD